MKIYLNIDKDIVFHIAEKNFQFISIHFHLNFHIYEPPTTPSFSGH